MLKRYIIMTTVSRPTPATIAFCHIANDKKWRLIVVGDRQTPHRAYRRCMKEFENVVYLHPDEQGERYPVLSDAIGWNSSQRRNIGFVYAYEMGAEVIATVDDDNLPYPTWGDRIYLNQDVEVDMWTTRDWAFDPLCGTGRPDYWHRGFPIECVPGRHERVTYKGRAMSRCLVQADLWDGDPDIDAIARISSQPRVKFNLTRPFASDRPVPFNSQNTFLSRMVIPSYCMLPHVGRSEDIWAAYILQVNHPRTVIFGPPSVYQARNDHDLVTDLENELFSYRHTYELVCDLPHYRRYLPPKALQVLDVYQDTLARMV